MATPAQRVSVQPSEPRVRRLVLLGGGHAHVKVLSDLSKRQLSGWRVSLISPHPRHIYSGMVPGWIAGHYNTDECALRLDELADQAAVSFHCQSGSGVDMSRKTILCSDGMKLPFDVLSINTGPVTSLGTIAGRTDHIQTIRPIEVFIAAWPSLVDQILRCCRRFDLVILGAGASGVELAFAIHRRALRDGWSHLRITLVGSDSQPLEGAPLSSRMKVSQLLAERGIAWRGGCRVVAATANFLAFEHGHPQQFDACLATTGTAAPSWLRTSGLETDERGFLRVGPTLQSISHPNVFAAGDVAAHLERLPKSGVYAVRAGPALSENLRSYCRGEQPRPWAPRTRALQLISTGSRHAIATWGTRSISGHWVWLWKNWIDRQFIRSFSAPSPRSKQ